MRTARHVLKSAARRVCRIAALGVALVLAAVAGVALYLQTAPGRASVARIVENAVSGELAGGLRIDRIDRISYDRLFVARASLLDPYGKPVMTAERLDVRFSLVALLRGILFADGVHVEVPDVHAGRFFISLARDDEGAFLVARAVAMASPSPGPPAQTFVSLPHVILDSASATTDLPGLERAKGELGAVTASLDVSPAGVVIGFGSDHARFDGLFARPARAELHTELRLPGETRTEFVARIGDVPVSGSLLWDGADLRLSLSSSGLEPGAMKDLLGGWPLVVPVRAAARANGPPPGMHAEGNGEVGKARLFASGSLELTPRVTADVTVRLDGFDLRALDAGAPETAIDVDARLTLDLDDGLAFNLDAATEASSVLGYPLPALTVSGAFAHGAFIGAAAVSDPRLATDAVIELLTDDGTFSFATTSPDLDLGALAAYGVTATGRGRVESQGVLQEGRLAATLDATLSSPDLGMARARRASLHGSVEGSLEAPKDLSMELLAEGEGLEALGVGLQRFRASSRGTAARQAVSLDGTTRHGAKFEANAGLSLGERVALSDVRVESGREPDAVRASAKRVAFGPAGFSIVDLSLKAGEGNVSGTIYAEGERRFADLAVNDLEVERLISGLGGNEQSVRGRLDGYARVQEERGKRSGDVALRLRDGALPSYPTVAADVRARFDGSDIDATGELEVPGFASGKVRARGAMRGSLFDPRAARDATGEASLEFTGVDLGQTSKPWLRGSSITVRGTGEGLLRVARSAPRGAPEVSFEVGARQLSVVNGADQGPLATPVDATLSGHLLTREGSRVSLRLDDRQGTWVTAELEHALTLAGLSRARDWSRALLDARASARVKVATRGLARFVGSGADVLQGTIGGGVEATGSARRPEVDATITVTGSTARGGTPARLEFGGRYSATQQRYAVRARARGPGSRITLDAEGRFGWVDQGLGKPWSTSGELHVEGIDLAQLRRVFAFPIEGKASGDCSFDVQPGSAEANGQIAIEGLALDGHTLGSGSGRLALDGEQAVATLRLAGKRSMVELLGEAGVTWTDGALALDPKRRGMLRATLQDFDLATIGRFLRGTVTQVSGKANGYAELSWTGGEKSGEPQTTLRANATVAEGTASLVAGGGLIRKIDVKALADGEGPLRLEFEGAARSRRRNLRGKAEVQFRGPDWKRFDVEVGAKSFPLLYDGVLLGRATTGSKRPVRVAMINEPDGQSIDVEVPSVRVRLPKSGEESLIALEDDPAIRIHDDAKKVERAAPSEGTTKLAVRLGNDVRIERSALDVPLGGEVQIARDGGMAGKIVLKQGGLVPVLGQLFRIRRGTVQLQGKDTSHATLAIQAWTRAADGTLIDLDLSGTVEEPVIAFQSDPPHSESEIVALLLGAPTDDQGDMDREEQVGTALAVAMNRVVKNSPLSGLQFGAGETGEGDAVTTVSMRVGKKVWLEGRSVRGTQTSVNPDDRVSGVVDWRFAPSFSLRTQLGEVSGVELRWSLRY